MLDHPVPRGRRVEPDPTLVKPQRAGRADAGVGDDDRTLTVVFTRGVWQRLHAVELHETPERVELEVLVGITPELAAEMERKQMFFTMQAIVEHTVVRLDAPLAGRELVVAGARPGPKDPGPPGPG